MAVLDPVKVVVDNYPEVRSGWRPKTIRNIQRWAIVDRSHASYIEREDYGDPPASTIGWRRAASAAKECLPGDL